MVSKTDLLRFDNNKYSVAASAVGRPVEVYDYASRIVIRQDRRIVAEDRFDGNAGPALGRRRHAGFPAMVDGQRLPEARSLSFRHSPAHKGP
jgi:hypothetical protein